MDEEKSGKGKPLKQDVQGSPEVPRHSCSVPYSRAWALAYDKHSKVTKPIHIYSGQFKQGVSTTTVSHACKCCGNF